MRDNEFCPHPVRPRIRVPGLEIEGQYVVEAITLIESLYLCWKYGSIKDAAPHSDYYSEYDTFRHSPRVLRERAGGKEVHVRWSRKFTLTEYGKWLIETYLGEEIPELSNPDLL